MLGAGKGKAGEQGKGNSIAEFVMYAVTLDYSAFGFQNLLQLTFLAEMSAGLTEENSDNENDDSVEDQDLERLSMNPPVRREDKKTVTQRNKEKERKAKELKTRQLKEDKQKEQELFRF